MKKRTWAAKLAAMAMSMILAASLTAPAMAASSGTQTNPTTNVTGTYEGSGGAVYSYSYSWGSMKFTYQAGSGTWDPDTHTVKAGSGSGTPTWTCAAGANHIKVINHSNRDVTATLTFEAKKAGFKGAFSELDSTQGYTTMSFDILSAVGTAYDAAPSHTVRFSPTTDSAGLSEGETDVVLGTITLSVKGK